MDYDDDDVPTDTPTSDSKATRKKSRKALMYTRKETEE